MKRIVFLMAVFTASVMVLSSGLMADDVRPGSMPDDLLKSWIKNNPNSLPIGLTPDEAKNWHLVGNTKPTAPPSGYKRNVAEFEPQGAVIIRYQFGISYSIIREMAEDTHVVTIVANSSQQNYVTSKYQQYNVNLNNCSFLLASTDSYWTRDYGPWSIFDQNQAIGIVDTEYNRPRPNDDKIPTKYANHMGYPVYAMDFITAGGNYMTDGHGIAAATNLSIKENPGKTKAQLEQMALDYLGINDFHFVKDALGQYIEHIDCWAKFLAPDKIMIIQTKTSSSNYKDLEDAATYWAAQTSCYGWPYKVYRVYTPNGQPYVNSLILNKKVLVPQTGSSWDDDALDAYEAAMPGYEVLGFSGSWVTTDALHCRTKGVGDEGMVYVHHTPLKKPTPTVNGITVEAEIILHSNGSFTGNTPEVLWRVKGTTPWNATHMNNTGGDDYMAYIPTAAHGTKIEYYLRASDTSGRTEYHPYIGEADAHELEVYDPILGSDVETLSERYGGVANLTLNAGAANANRPYLILGSVTGSTPGTPMPGGMVTLPINWDLFTNLMTNLINGPIFKNFYGNLDGAGLGSAQFDTLGPLPTGSKGMIFTYAFALDLPWNFVSNPIDIEVID